MASHWDREEVLYSLDHKIEQYSRRHGGDKKRLTADRRQQAGDGSIRQKELAILDKMSKDQQQAAQDRSDRLQKNLMDFVKGGKGFVGIHAATDTFYKFPEFGEMINGYFSGHPWGAGTPVSIKVEPGQEKHPVVAMLDGKNLEFKEEIYQLKDPYDSKKVHMLLRLDTERSPMDLKGIKRTDKDFGVAWIRNWGQGRVFYCSLGHNDHIYQNATVLEHYLAGIQWAMGDLKAPVNVTK